MPLVIAICVTRNFTDAMGEQVRRIVANLRDEPPGHVVLSGDSSPELKAVVSEYQRLLPDDVKQQWEAFEAKVTALQKQVRECPPDGNIWQVIGKHGWRPRGWLDHVPIRRALLVRRRPSSGMSDPTLKHCLSEDGQAVA